MCGYGHRGRARQGGDRTCADGEVNDAQQTSATATEKANISSELRWRRELPGEASGCTGAVKVAVASQGESRVTGNPALR